MTTLARCCVCSFIIFTHWCSTVSAQVVDIPDLNLRKAVRETLALPDEIPLTRLVMKQLTGLDAGNNQIKDLTGLEYATNLIRLSLPRNEIQDLSPLAELLNLGTLHLWSNPISNLSPLGNLIQVRRLGLDNCRISDITPLANLTGLTFLSLPHNQIQDITLLANLTQLTELHLHSNRIEDISSLVNLTQLKVLGLYYNRIEDITPLAKLTQLTELYLNNNRIIDVSPLAGLESLMTLNIGGNAIRDFSSLLELNLKNVDIDIHMLQELAAVDVEIPDSNLERAIGEQLGLPDGTPLTQLAMTQLTGLDAGDSQIEDLTGLEHATNLTWLALPGNEIQNLSPLAELFNLETLYLWVNPISDLSPLANLTQLSVLDLGACQILDLTPLANLTQLKSLSLHYNLVEDIGALTKLTQLTKLNLTSNRIMDVSPLANLTMLKELYIHNNAITDFSPLAGLSLTHFEYDEVCELTDIPGVPVQERKRNRSFPSIFNAWGIITNRPALSREVRLAHHDLYWSPRFELHFLEMNQGVRLVGYLDKARQERDALLSLNPNMIFIRGIAMRDARSDVFPEDSPYWIRDGDGSRVPIIEGDSVFLTDFTHPGLQDIIVQQAIAVAKCGLYDGIFLDWWKEGHAVLRVDWSKEGYRGNEAEQRARDTIIQRIRAGVGDDFLILVNPNRSKPQRAASYINGLFMETLRDYDGGYKHDGLIRIESTLLWAEESLREPQVNCLEGWGVETEAPDSPTNRQWMRVFTTMGLTHSDGYVQINTLGDGHDYWYDFWDADLGRPIGPKAQPYQNIDGLFIREFTNGWAVYNRSGAAQTITLPTSATPVSDRGNNAVSLTHLLPDLDGEIYLKAAVEPPTSPYDLNKDGTVNVLDLILTAQNFGGTGGDVNGDGTTNILDLILVAQHFGDASLSAAPAALSVSLSPETVQAWIDMAHAQNDGSVTFAQGIAMLERLLALMIPDKTVLRANYPNPFNPETWIPYHLASDTEVRISIYDIQGVLVRQFNLGYQKAGYYTDRRKAAYWDGRNEIGESVASGVYFYTLTTDDYTGTRRMVIIK